MAQRIYDLGVDTDDAVEYMQRPNVKKALFDYLYAGANVKISYIERGNLCIVAGYVTTRPVVAGEEALTMYGPTYWRPGVGF